MTIQRINLWKCLAAVLAAACLSAPSRSQNAERFAPPTDQESAIFRAVLGRLKEPANAERMPVPVPDVLRSLTQEVVRTFPGTASSRYKRVTIRIQTRHVHWDPAAANASMGEHSSGLYVWNWKLVARRAGDGREVVVTAHNVVMIDPTPMDPNEKDTLGRMANEALLYHEFLHGQLAINAMNDPRWRATMLETATFDITARDPGHVVIRNLERDYLVSRGETYAYTIAPSNGAGDDPGAFRIAAGRMPRDYSGRVNMKYRVTAASNVTDVRLELGREGAQRGRVAIRGRLIDPTKSGYFLALIDPLIRSVE